MEENPGPQKEDNADKEEAGGSGEPEEGPCAEKRMRPSTSSGAPSRWSSSPMSEGASTSSDSAAGAFLPSAADNGDPEAGPAFPKAPNRVNRNYRKSRSAEPDEEDEDDESYETAPEREEENAATLRPDEEPLSCAAYAATTPIAPEGDSNDWEDYVDINDEDDLENLDVDVDVENDDDDDDADDAATSSDPEELFSSTASTSGSNSNDAAEDVAINIDDHPIFKKDKPKANWFVLDELKNRQMGYSAKMQSRGLFQRRCYGSLHCVKRLELMYKLEEHNGCVNSLNFHPDGTLLASGSDDYKVIIWDWKVAKPLVKFKTKHKSNVFQSKFLNLSGDLHIASCARDGQVRVAQISRTEGVRSVRLLGTHAGPCHKLITIPEQPQIILSAGEDGVVLSHDLREPKSTKVITVKEDGREVALYSIHGHPLKSHEFCVSGRDTLVRVYDQRKTNEPASIFTALKKVKGRGVSPHVTCAVYNYDGSEILASYSDEDIYLFNSSDPTPGSFTHKYQGHRNKATIKGVNFFGPKSEYIVSGSDCGHVYFWERNTESLVQWLLADDNGVVNCLEPHPQLPFICTSGLDWDVKVWVPSCETDPPMEGLKKILQENLDKSNFQDPDINESQMLWMLWRHLRNSSRRRSPRNLARLFSYQESNSSSGTSNNSEESDEEFDASRNCNTS